MKTETKTRPNSLTDKAFVLESERTTTGSTPVWDIGDCAYRKDGR